MSTNLLDLHGQPIVRNFNSKRVIDRSIDELLGLCRGVIADNRLSFEEADFIRKWLLRNEPARSCWPGDVLFRRVADALQDGIFDEKEEVELLDFMRGLTGEQPLYDQVCNLSSSLPLDEPQPVITFDDCTFCFTGKFIYGSRSTCENLVRELGGHIVSKPNDYTDYLVVGVLGSRDWIHSSHGRKIELAVDLRKARSGIAIVSEEHWTKSLTQYQEGI